MNRQPPNLEPNPYFMAVSYIGCGLAGVGVLTLAALILAGEPLHDIEKSGESTSAGLERATVSAVDQAKVNHARTFRPADSSPLDVSAHD